MYLVSSHNQMKKISFIVLFFLLCAVISHSTHELITDHQASSTIDLSSDNGETLSQQTVDIECNLCSNPVEAQKDIDLLGHYSPAATYAANAIYSPLWALSKYYLLPNLRGPPTLNSFQR
jgi:hypothetical protein